MSSLEAPPAVSGAKRPIRISIVAGLWAGWAVTVLVVASIAARSGTAAPGPWAPEIARVAPPLARWDSGWYASIVRDGYSYEPTHDQNNIGFYPLYPFLTRGIASATHLPYFQVGIAISLAAVLAALILLARSTPAADTNTILAILVFPASFILAAFYAEGLYLAASVATFFLARRRMWILAGIAAAAACLTRVNGVTLLPALAWLALEARRLDDGRDDAVRMTALGLAASGAAAYPVHLWRRFGDPLLYFHDKVRGWPTFSIGRFWRPFLAMLHEAHVFLRHPDSPGRLPFAAEAASLALLIGTIFWCSRRKLIAETLYTGALLAMVVFGGNFDGLHRYAATAFPCFFAIGDGISRSRIARFAYLVLGAGIGLLMLVHFVRWKYVG